jgi:hypothetical protein
MQVKWNFLGVDDPGSRCNKAKLLASYASFGALARLLVNLPLLSLANRSSPILGSVRAASRSCQALNQWLTIRGRGTAMGRFPMYIFRRLQVSCRSLYRPRLSSDQKPLADACCWCVPASIIAAWH